MEKLQEIALHNPLALKNETLQKIIFLGFNIDLIHDLNAMADPIPP